MEIQTIQKNIPTTARKLRLVADLIRKTSPLGAVQVLKFTNKAAAQHLSKAIQTVVANSIQAGMNQAQITFKKLEVNEGLVMKRVRAAGRSHRRPYVKKTSHIKIVLTDDVSTKKGEHGTKN